MVQRVAVSTGPHVGAVPAPCRIRLQRGDVAPLVESRESFPGRVEAHPAVWSLGPARLWVALPGGALHRPRDGDRRAVARVSCRRRAAVDRRDLRLHPGPRHDRAIAARIHDRDVGAGRHRDRRGTGRVARRLVRHAAAGRVVVPLVVDRFVVSALSMGGLHPARRRYRAAVQPGGARRICAHSPTWACSCLAARSWPSRPT